MRKTSEKQFFLALALAATLIAGGAGGADLVAHDRDASQGDRVAADRYGYSEEEARAGRRATPEPRGCAIHLRLRPPARPRPLRHQRPGHDRGARVVRYPARVRSQQREIRRLHRGIRELPRLSLSDLLDLQVRPNTFPDGRVELDVGYESEFEGEGEYARTETMTGRITARVVDIRPNGTLVLEARKTLVNDGEEVSIVATGICRVQDITPDNTVLSTQLYDLFIDKQHEGELKDSTEKGILSRLLDFFFPF